MKPDSSRPNKLAPLRFATSNVAKFLQARLMMQDSGQLVDLLNVHFRSLEESKFYGLPKKAFLKECLKAVVGRASPAALTFIEDTTVSVPGLGKGSDFPGQATKEWFLATSHSEVLASLGPRKEDRAAIVMSDIALHVPGHSEPVYFSGETAGSIVSRVPRVEPNPVYPWLGRNDFSSWFVPDGADKVLAAMSLEESLRYDFRWKSLLSLAERLDEYCSVLNLPSMSVRRGYLATGWSPSQMVLFPDVPADIVIVVVGRIAAGKTTVGHHLGLNRDFYHIEGSRALREAALGYGYSPEKYLSLFDLADELFRDKCANAVESAYVSAYLEEVETPVVYTGARTLEGLAAVKKAAARLGRPFAILEVSSRSSIRLVRANVRLRGSEVIEPLQFDGVSTRDAAYGAAAFSDLICDAKVRNSGSLNMFLANVDSAVSRLRSGVRRHSRARMELADKLRRADERTIGDVLSEVSAEFVELIDGVTIPSSKGLAVIDLLIGPDEDVSVDDDNEANGYHAHRANAAAD